MLLFFLAVAGTLSAATFPGVLLAYDLFVERRPVARSLWDKVPFVLGAGIIALIVASAQPSMGNRPNAYVLSAALLLQNVWLLTGLDGMLFIVEISSLACCKSSDARRVTFYSTA